MTTYTLTFTKVFLFTVISNSNCPDKTNVEFFEIVKSKQAEGVVMFTRFPNLQSTSNSFTFNQSNYQVIVLNQ
jgi:hypothetical protein